MKKEIGHWGFAGKVHVVSDLAIYDLLSSACEFPPSIQRESS
jgi:hypothetical protein